MRNRHKVQKQMPGGKAADEKLRSKMAPESIPAEEIEAELEEILRAPRSRISASKILLDSRR